MADNDSLSDSLISDSLIPDTNVNIEPPPSNNICPVCKTFFPLGVEGWTLHCLGRKHKRLLSSPDVRTMPANFCSVCNTSFPNGPDGQSKHCLGRKHQKIIAKNLARSVVVAAEESEVSLDGHAFYKILESITSTWWNESDRDSDFLETCYDLGHVPLTRAFIGLALENRLALENKVRLIAVKTALTHTSPETFLVTKRGEFLDVFSVSLFPGHTVRKATLSITVNIPKNNARWMLQRFLLQRNSMFCSGSDSKKKLDFDMESVEEMREESLLLETIVIPIKVLENPPRKFRFFDRPLPIFALPRFQYQLKLEVVDRDGTSSSDYPYVFMKEYMMNINYRKYEFMTPALNNADDMLNDFEMKLAMERLEKMI